MSYFPSNKVNKQGNEATSQSKGELPMTAETQKQAHCSRDIPGGILLFKNPDIDSDAIPIQKADYNTIVLFSNLAIRYHMMVSLDEAIGDSETNQNHYVNDYCFNVRCFLYTQGIQLLKRLQCLQGAEDFDFDVTVRKCVTEIAVTARSEDDDEYEFVIKTPLERVEGIMSEIIYSIKKYASSFGTPFAEFLKFLDSIKLDSVIDDCWTDEMHCPLDAWFKEKIDDMLVEDPNRVEALVPVAYKPLNICLIGSLRNSDISQVERFAKDWIHCSCDMANLLISAGFSAPDRIIRYGKIGQFCNLANEVWISEVDTVVVLPKAGIHTLREAIAFVNAGCSMLYISKSVKERVEQNL